MGQSNRSGYNKGKSVTRECLLCKKIDTTNKIDVLSEENIEVCLGSVMIPSFIKLEMKDNMVKVFLGTKEGLVVHSTIIRHN